MIVAYILLWLSGAAFGAGTAFLIAAEMVRNERHQPPWDRKGEPIEAP